MLTQNEVVELLEIYSNKSSTSKQKANARELLLVWLEEKRAAKERAKTTATTVATVNK